MLFTNWLKKPYFFIDSPKLNLQLSFGIGVFIFLFLYLFEPFGIYNSEINLLYYTLGFGLVTFFILSFYFLILPILFKNFFKDENWTVGKNIGFVLFLVLSITVANWFYSCKILNTANSGYLTLKDFFVYTFSLAIFPIVIFTYITEKVYTNWRKKTAKKLMSLRNNDIDIKKKIKITIFGDNKKESITFYLHNLVYISSHGNYASFFINNNDAVEEHIIRNTLSKIMVYFKMYNTIIRCHKSYIVNINNIQSISGNARGYFLNPYTSPQQIPVSRKFKKDQLAKLIK